MARRNTKLVISDSEEEDAAMSLEGVSSPVAGSSTTTKRTTTVKERMEIVEDSEEEQDEDEGEVITAATSTRSTPRRNSAIQASKRLTLPRLILSDEEDEDQVDEMATEGQDSDVVMKEKDEETEDSTKQQKNRVVVIRKRSIVIAKKTSVIVKGKGKMIIVSSDEEDEESIQVDEPKNRNGIVVPGSSSKKITLLKKVTSKVVIKQKERSASATTSKHFDSAKKKAVVKGKGKEVRVESPSGSEFEADVDQLAATSSSSSSSEEEVMTSKATSRKNDDSSDNEEGSEAEEDDDNGKEKKKGAGGEKKEKVGPKPRQGAVLSPTLLKEMKKMNRYQKTEAQLKANHAELVNCWGEINEIAKWVPMEAEQPAGITLKLLPFQLEGLSWMIGQERSIWKGGLLADEMGMGKTIQTIALILSDYDKNKRQCTLVLAPTVALIQWKNEIEKFTRGIKVLVFHGATRIDNTRDMAKYDVILTSYGIMESSFRREHKGFMKKGQLHKEDSILHKMKWHRIILDESHAIKDRSSNQAKAAFSLTGVYKWCLSGTPLQNRVGELYSLVRFLGADPFAFYFCKKCDCKSLHWLSVKGPCSECRHSGMQHVCYWNAEVLKPIQFGGVQSGEGETAFKKLRTLLEHMMLRRTKVERADDLGLPPRVIRVRRDYFTEEEEEIYRSLYQDVARKFNTYASEGTLLNNYSNLFTLITRMRQAADHVLLCLKSTTAAPVQHAVDDLPENILTCRLCLDEAEEAIVSACKHTFCRECVRQYIDSAIVATPECPVCNSHLTIDLNQEPIEVDADNAPRQGFLGRIDPSKYRSSTKIEALVEELSKLRTQDSTIKSLVFSQFTSMLDLVERRLQLGGFKSVRLQGSMTPTKRAAIIERFTTDTSITVFLISLKAGGVALNLTEASSVFLLDPWWNPSVELQAMDRIHRLGQHRPVVVTRLIIENSIESRILELQRKKEAMTGSTLGDDADAMGKLTPADFQFLFNL